MTPENQVKLALLQEYKKAVRYQDFYSEGCEVLSGLIEQAVRYYREHGLDIPERDKLYRLAEGLEALSQKHLEFAKTILPPDENKHRHDYGLPDGEVTEPTIATFLSYIRALGTFRANYT
jgi:hypothetical protein